MELTRKEMLKLSVLGSAALLLPIERVVMAQNTSKRLRQRDLPDPFIAELPVPRC